MRKHAFDENALTLVELMIAAVILTLTFLGVLLTFLRCMELNEISRNTTLGLEAASSKIEEIKNTSFAQIFATHNDQTFTAAGVDGIGVVRIDNTNPQLLQVFATFCWRQSNGRVFGEDTDLDGQLDAGEDSNANGRIDSSVQLVDYIYNR